MLVLKIVSFSAACEVHSSISVPKLVSLQIMEEQRPPCTPRAHDLHIVLSQAELAPTVIDSLMCAL